MALSPARVARSGSEWLGVARSGSGRCLAPAAPPLSLGLRTRPAASPTPPTAAAGAHPRTGAPMERKGSPTSAHHVPHWRSQAYTCAPLAVPSAPFTTPQIRSNGARTRPTGLAIRHCAKGVTVRMNSRWWGSNPGPGRPGALLPTHAPADSPHTGERSPARPKDALQTFSHLTLQTLVISRSRL